MPSFQRVLGKEPTSPTLKEAQSKRVKKSEDRSSSAPALLCVAQSQFRIKSRCRSGLNRVNPLRRPFPTWKTASERIWHACLHSRRRASGTCFQPWQLFGRHAFVRGEFDVSRNIVAASHLSRPAGARRQQCAAASRYMLPEVVNPCRYCCKIAGKYGGHFYKNSSQSGAGYVTCAPFTFANEVSSCVCVRFALMMSSTAIPRASSASPIKER